MRPLSQFELRDIAESYLKMISEAARIGSDGYDSLGFDKDGYDRLGKNMLGINRDGYDDEGYDILGFDRDGWSKEGWPSPRRDPEAYGLKPEEVEDWIKSETEKKLARARTVLSQRKSMGKHSEGKYVKREGNVKHDSLPKADPDFERKMKQFAGEYAIEQRLKANALRHLKKEEYLASEEGKAEQAAKRERLAQRRKTDEFRASHNEYQKDYNRARQLLYGSRHATMDDIIWMSTNPVFKRLKAKRDEERKSGNEPQM